MYPHFTGPDMGSQKLGVQGHPQQAMELGMGTFHGATRSHQRASSALFLFRLFSLLAASLSWAASCSPCWSRVSDQFPSVKAVYCPLHPFFLSLLGDWVLSLQ